MRAVMTIQNISSIIPKALFTFPFPLSVNIFYYTKIFIKNLANFQQVYHKNMLDLEFPHKLFVIIYDNIQKIAFNHIFKITISSSHIAELLAHLHLSIPLFKPLPFSRVQILSQVARILNLLDLKQRASICNVSKNFLDTSCIIKISLL